MPTLSVAAGTHPRTREHRAGTAPGFAAALRAATGDAHRAVEAATGLDAQLRDRAAYGALLRRLLPVQAGLEAALLGFDGADVAPGVVLPALRPRAVALRADLAALGADAIARRQSAGATASAQPASDANPLETAAELPRLDGLAAALGCRYVLDGSALGGRIVARAARAALGDDLPTAFFGGEQAPRGAEWRALQAALDAFGTGSDAAGRAAAVASARETFAVVGACMRAPVAT